MADGTLTYLNRKGVKLNGRGIRQLLNSDGVRKHITTLAEQVLQEAIATAPVASGAYRDGLHVEQGTTDRVVVRVRGNTEHDWFVEANHGTLARAMGMAGVKTATEERLTYTTKSGKTRTATQAQIDNWTRGSR